MFTKKFFITFTISTLFFANSFANQTTDTIIMIAPEKFRYNEQAASTNKFQTKLDVGNLPMKEFRNMVAKLKKHGINVITLNNKQGADTPDAVFPNNWFSTIKNPSGKRSLVVYPMYDKNRQQEKQTSNVIAALEKHGTKINEVIDYSDAEHKGIALEGTGSMILDRENKIVYASISKRTDKNLLLKFANDFGFDPVIFTSYDLGKQPVYHTNVIMSVGSNFAVLCTECILDQTEREKVLSKLKSTGKEVIHINQKQVKNMAGNIIELKNSKQKSKIVMSQRAFEAFTNKQLATIKQYGDVINVQIPTIETVGGGSARCMIAEIF